MREVPKFSQSDRSKERKLPGHRQYLTGGKRGGREGMGKKGLGKIRSRRQEERVRHQRISSGRGFFRGTGALAAGVRAIVRRRER